VRPADRASMSVTAAPLRQRTPFWRNVRVLRIAFQAAFLLGVVIFILALVENLTTNLRVQGIRTDFGYLQQPAGFAIADADFRPSQSIWDAIKVGAMNTIKVSLLGILLATILGIVIGVARLSTNWLVRRSAAIYVETLRNIPVLVIILFWWLAVLLQLPAIRRAVDLNVIVISNRGLVGPGLEQTAALTGFLVVGAIGVASAIGVWVWRTRHFDRTGEPHHRVLWSAGVLVLFVVAGFFAFGQPVGISLPERGELATTGGFRLSPEYAALLVGLALYTASHIAEIVRGSILAVPRGQTEAANAVGLSGFQRLRFVVLPQAFRVSIPPIANQYLNLVKNSSLGVAIAFPEVTRVTRIAIGQQAPAPQSILVLMGVYLFFSLVIALVMNIINRRLTLKGR
jgi:general L-amino acid transport system permease protein